MDDIHEHIERTRLKLRITNQAMDLEEANNGDTEFLDLMAAEQTWMLADAMLELLGMTEGGGGDE